MYIFGGYTGNDYTDQITLVESCHLIRLGTMPVTFQLGACNSFQTSTGDEQTLLCFASSGAKHCHRFIITTFSNTFKWFFSFDGKSVTTYISANYDHYETSLGQLQNAPVALGGYPNKKVEVLLTGKWSELADFPFVEEYIYRYSFVNFNNALYLFGKIFYNNCHYWTINIFKFSLGGYADGKQTDLAVRMDEIYIDENIWTNVGPLLSIRYGHRSIVIGNAIMHIGGSGTKTFVTKWVKKTNLILSNSFF